MKNILKKLSIILPDKMYVKLKYFLVFKKKIDLKNPKGFNEKIQYLKLNDRKDIYATMVDKYEAKQYVSKIIGSEYIIPTLGIYNSWEDINFEELPEKFVIKCTHDSGGVVICRNKKKFNFSEAEKKIKKSLNSNYYELTREYPYKNIKPRILVEKYMEDKDNKNIVDYKFFCFDGETKIMYISQGLENHETAKMSFYDMDFKLTSCKRKDFSLLDYVPKKPLNFEKMKEFSELLSKDIPHLRVDWYEINGRLFFGELTFYTCSGLVPFESDDWDKKLGSYINIK